MAVLAIPLLEMAFTALLVAVGVTVGTAVISDEIKSRQRDAADAGTAPVAKTASQTQTKTCSKCPPDCGQLVQRNWSMSPAAREYQARVTGFAPRTEWSFAGVDFDGFSSGDCMLKEAKARYDQFLTGGEDEDTEVEPKKWYRAFTTKMLPQAEVHSGVARANPPTKLTWFFQGLLTYEYMSPKLRLLFPLVPVYLP